MGRRIVIVLAVVVGLAAVGWGAWAWHRSTIEVSTDDAYVDGMISPVSAKVSGHVVELLVNDNTAVRAGDVLLRVDPRDYEAKRAQARAAVGVAEASVRAARADSRYDALAGGRGAGGPGGLPRRRARQRVGRG